MSKSERRILTEENLLHFEICDNLTISNVIPNGIPNVIPTVINSVIRSAA